MSDNTEVARRVERQLGEDPRTAELGIHVRVRGGQLFAEGKVMTEERRQSVLAVIRELVPDAEVHDQLTVTGGQLSPPGTTEQID